MNSKRLFSSRKRGLTLTEVLVASSISVALGASAMWFVTEGTRSSLKAASTSINDISQWSIFTAISVDSKIANGMTVYKNFTREEMKDNSFRLNNAERGNVLILTRSIQKPNAKKTSYTQITGYIFSATTKNLRKFVYAVPEAEQGNPALGVEPKTLEEILIDNFETFAPRSIADELHPTTTGAGVFLVRERGQSGILTVESIQGTNTRHKSKKLIDASFFIRG